jgi:hypothetical protein
VKARFIAGTLGCALFVVVACSTANMTSYTPVEEKTKYKEDTLFRAARDAAEDLGFVVTAGEGSSTFDTREKQVATSSIPRLSYKYTFHVETSGGVLSIKASCSKNSTTNESEFSDCGDDRPKRVVDLQEKLHQLTLKRAVKDQDRAPDFSHFGEAEEAPDAGKASKASNKGGDKADKSKGSDKADKSKGSDKADKSKDDDESDSKESGKDSKESGDKDAKDTKAKAKAAKKKK